MAKNVDELQVYQKALAAAADISAIIQRPSFNRDMRLRDQLGSSSERVASLIAEGSEQSTDRHFAEYCYRSKGSAREMRTQLIASVQRTHIAGTERIPLDWKYEEHRQDAERPHRSSRSVRLETSAAIAATQAPEPRTCDPRLATRGLVTCRLATCRLATWNLRLGTTVA
jgi:four helix bundle protein